MGITHYESGSRADIQFIQNPLNVKNHREITTGTSAVFTMRPDSDKRWTIHQVNLERGNIGTVRLSLYNNDTAGEFTLEYYPAVESGNPARYRPVQPLHINTLHTLKATFGAGVSGMMFMDMVGDESLNYQ